VTKEN